MTDVGGPPDDEALAGLAALLRRAGTTLDCDVIGDSMTGAIPANSTVRIRFAGASDAPIGTVVALLLGGALSVPRLVHRGRSARARGWVVTEGDGNLSCEAPVPESEILGVVESVRDGPGTWRVIGPAVPRPWRRQVIAIAARRLMILGLEAHPRIGLGLKGLMMLAMTPLVWLHPYPAGSVRRASVAHRRDDRTRG